MKRKRKERRPVRSLTAVTVRLGALLLAVWLVCMGFLTLGTAQYVVTELADKGYALAENAAGYGMLAYFYKDYEDLNNEKWEKDPERIEYEMFRSIPMSGPYISAPSFDVYRRDDVWIPNIYREGNVYCQTAIMFVDPEGRIIHRSGDYVFFPYVTEDVWLAQEEEQTRSGYGWIDLGDEEDERYLFLRNAYSGKHSLYDYEVMRLTGYFDGTRFEPHALATLEYLDVMFAVDAIREETHTSYLKYTLSGLDADGRIEWDVRFDNTADVPEGQELVTIYALRPDITINEEGGSVRYCGERYENLVELLSSMSEYWSDGSLTLYSSMSDFSLTRLTVFSSYKFYDLSDYGPYAGDEFPEADFTLMSAVTANPLLITLSFLRNVYIITFALTLVGFLLLRGAIRNRLIIPLEKVNGAIADGWTNLYYNKDKPTPYWWEAHELSEHYAETQNTLRMRKNEITRLNTALEYAQTAEENRRQMVSHIAHEFKTPLAVIHSYAEGLNEHIAEGKREKYVEVILSESERLDAMVLELLDLSRLEAGKVKLARDEFDLAALARSVFERLERAAADKTLNVELDFPETCLITADEGRLRQVIENFASNAVKYTPAGGGIKARISVTPRSGIAFAVENDSEPFSQEALPKVWDTFYRADSARTGEGTGLGLAIAKNIVELHGGKCAVHNTKTGVEFSFTL